MKKLNKHPYYKSKSQEYKQRLAVELTDPEELKMKFSHLLDVGTKFAMQITREREDDFESTQEFREHHEEVKQKTAQACNLQVRLSLRSIPEGKLPLIHSFTSRLKFEYGPFHASLTIEDVTLSWGRESIVEPRFDPIAGADFQALVGDQGEWDVRRGEFVQKMSMVDRQANKEEKFNAIYQSLTEKTQMIANLVDVIADYNRNKKYHVFKCNCQHFVKDAMAALGINKPLQFDGLLQQRFEQLKKGRLRVPPELRTHENVDTHVVAFKDELERHDMEYLQCLYFDFHLPAIEESDNPDLWRCDKPTCMSEELDKMIREKSLSLTQSSANSPQLQAKNGVSDDTEVTFEMFPGISRNGDYGETPLSSIETTPPQLEEVCPTEFLEMSLPKQTKLVSKFKGYRDEVLTKYKRHPCYKQEREEEMVEILTERERLFQDYFSSYVDRSRQSILETTEDYKKLEKGECRWEQVSSNIRKRFDKLWNFPLRLIYRVDFKNVKARKPVLQTPLNIILQFDDITLEWVAPGLVIPAKAEKPTGNIVRVEHIILLEDLSRNSDWSEQVQRWKMLVESAITEKEHTIIIPIMYEVTEEQERLVNSLLQLVVRYNRYSCYNSKRCNNVHFIQDALNSLGSPDLPATSTSLRKYLDNRPTSVTLTEVTVAEHSKLDSYLNGRLVEQPSVQELEDHVSKYFMLHFEDWKQKSRGKQEWTCSLESCQLMHLLKQMAV